MKDIIIEKNHQNLELIKKEVPNYDWKQQRLECKTMVWDNDFRRRKNPTRSIGEGVKFYYETQDSKNRMSGWIEMSCGWNNDKTELIDGKNLRILLMEVFIIGCIMIKMEIYLPKV